MNDAYYTETGERPDLAALEVNAPEGYIGPQIMPIVPVTDKSGTVYYNDLTTDETAETGRSAGSGPSGTQIATTSTAFACVEHCDRGKITPDEAKVMGGIAKADVVGAKWAKRQVMNALEADICSVILGKAASTQFDAAKLMAQAQTALSTIQLYEGKSALIASTAVLKRIVQALLNDDSMGAVFSRTIAGVNPMVAATGMNFSAWRDALAMFLGVDVVLAGNDTIWNATAYDGHFAFAKLDDGTDPLSHKWRPVLGKVFQFMPDGKQPWVIQSVADRVNVNNLYDAYLWFDSVLMNTGALYVIDGVAA
jgi:hypothetical protein